MVEFLSFVACLLFLVSPGIMAIAFMLWSESMSRKPPQ